MAWASENVGLIRALLFLAIAFRSQKVLIPVSKLVQQSTLCSQSVIGEKNYSVEKLFKVASYRLNTSSVRLGKHFQNKMLSQARKKYQFQYLRYLFQREPLELLTEFITLDLSLEPVLLSTLKFFQITTSFSQSPRLDLLQSSFSLFKKMSSRTSLFSQVPHSVSLISALCLVSISFFQFYYHCSSAH